MRVQSSNIWVLAIDVTIVFDLTYIWVRFPLVSTPQIFCWPLVWSPPYVMKLIFPSTVRKKRGVPPLRLAVSIPIWVYSLVPLLFHSMFHRTHGNWLIGPKPALKVEPPTTKF